MALPAAPTLTTTLSAALTEDGRRVSLTATTNLEADHVLVIGYEMMRVIAVDTTANIADVRRGIAGTVAMPHQNGVDVYGGASSEFEIDASRYPARPGRAGYTGTLGRFAKMSYPLGSLYTDPDTGFQYRLVDCQSSFIVGEWVTITGAGLASQLADGQEGRVGIIIDAVGASDTLAWAIVAGTYASALLDSDLTTAGLLAAAAGHAAPLDSTADNWIRNARCIVAPSTATSPAVGDGIGTVYIDHPWTTGVDEFFTS